MQEEASIRMFMDCYRYYLPYYPVLNTPRAPHAFRMMYVSVSFRHYDKMTETNKLQGEKFYFDSWPQRFQFIVPWFRCFGACVSTVGRAIEETVHYCQGAKEKVRRDLGSQYLLQGHPPREPVSVVCLLKTLSPPNSMYAFTL